MGFQIPIRGEGWDRSDSNRGVDDSNRDNDEGDNEVFVPVGGGPLRWWGG
ncbi:hypothetical protein GBF38_013937, partial [Nibea albiflora]